MRPEVIAEASLRRVLCIAGRRLDVGALRVHGDGEAQRMTPKAVGVLLELAREPGVTRTREELLLRVWAGRAGEGGDVLTQAVKELRRVFADDPAAPHLIETVPRLGYRLLAPVEWEDPPTGPAIVDAIAETRGVLAASPRRRWLVIAVLIATGGLAALAAALQPDPTAAGSVAPTPIVLTADPGAESTPRLSPDASRLAYVAIDPDTSRQRIHVRGVNASTTLFPTEGRGEESWPVWSADGAQLAFVRRIGQECRMVTVDALGGAERIRGTCASGLFESFDWAPDDRTFAVARFGGPGTARLALAAVEGGDALPFDYAHDPAEHDLAPHYSPDGLWIAFRRGLSPYCDLYVVAASGGAVRRLTHLSALMRGFDWLPDGSGLVFASNHGGTEALYRVDLADGRVTALGVAPAQMPDIARHGEALVYEVPRTRSIMQGVLLDGGFSGGAEITPSTGSDAHAALSPDSGRLAFVSDRGGSPQLWLHDSDGRQTYALTRDAGATFLYPQWSADGRRVLVTRRRGGRGELVEIDLGSQIQQAVTMPDIDVRFGTYAPGDGFLIIDGTSGHPRLLSVAHTRGPARAPRDGVSAVEVDAASGRIYYSRADGAGVRELRDRPEDEVVLAPVGNRFAWHVRAGAVWYFASDESSHDEIVLRRRSLVDASDTVVWRTREAIDHRSFDLSADARRLVLVRITRNDTDIALLRFLRPRR